MNNLKTRLSVLLLSTFCLLTGAYAQITPSADASTSSLAPTQNYGSNGYLYVHSATQVTYVQFDLSTIPSGYTGANIAKASLKVYLYSVAGGGTFNVDYVTSPWTEKTITFNDSPTLGGFIAASGNIAAANAKDYVIIDITPAVQAWLNGTESNNGIALVGNGTFNAGFESKENTVTSHPPELDIVFAGGSAITGITTGSGSGLTGGGTSGTLNLSLTNACAPNQILEWNGTAWVCAFAGVGTITGVTTQPGLTGGGTAGNVAIGIDNTVVPLLNLENQFTASQSILGSLTATYLGASGTITAGGGALFPSTGNSPTSGSPSSPLDLTASASNGTIASYQTFRWQAANVDGTAPSANLNLLFGSAGATPAATGLSIAPNGIISFAANQTFPGGGGGGVTSVTGTNGVNAATSGGSVTLSANQGVVAFQTDLTAGITTAETTAENYASANFLPLTAASSFATIGANTFTGNQTITGDLFASRNVGIGTTAPQATLDVNGAINAATSFNLSGQLFAWGNVSTLVANTAVGFNTLPVNATGNINTAVGYGALSSNTTGGANTAVGDYALQQNTAGSENTAVGEGALSGNTGNFNTGLGFHAVAGGGNFYNATAIGANAEVDEPNALVLGSILNTNGCVAANNCASVNVGIGTTTPQFTLDVHGNANITGSLTVGNCNGCGGGGGGGSGTVTSVAAGTGLLASPSPITTSGTLSINTAVVPQLNVANTFAASQSITGNLTATGTISGAILSGTTITGTTITGTTVSASKLFATGGLYLNGNTTNPFAYASGSGAGDNAFVGFAGESVNAAAPGDENTGVGYQALNVNGKGSTGGFQSFGNSAMGAQTLFNNTIGNDNTASGTNALYNNTAGNYNAANGDAALFTNSAGNNNTASGHSSLYNTTGSFNTGSGSNALQYNAGGSYNTALGAFSGPDTASTGLTNSTAIGAYAVVSQSNSLVLGSIGGVNGCTSPCLSASVGIGTSKPGATLDVEGIATTTPTVNFGSVSVPATLTVNGNTTLTNLTVTGTCNGCGGGGGGGGITSVTGTNGVNAVTSGGAVTLSLNPAAANTFTSTQTINTSTGNGVSATSSSSSSSGLSGSNTSTSGLANGVAGSTNSPLGSGVVGVNQSTATLGGGYGVYGLASAPANVGVGGVNNTTAAGSAYGVFGQSFGSTGAGVFGTGVGSGVTGSTSSPTGSGVVATNFATSGNAYGVYAQSSSSPSGTGVYGTGSAAGVYGVAASSTGTGVVGVSNAGWAGFFQGSVNVTNNLSVVNNAQVLGNAAVTGTLSVGGDTPMSHSPRMTFSGTVANFTTSQFQPAGYLVLDQPIVITRFTTASGNLDNISQCGPYSQMGFIVSVPSPYSYFITTGNVSYADSGPLNVLVPAGANIQIVGLEGNGSGGAFCQSGGNMTATIQYAMQ